MGSFQGLAHAPLRPRRRSRSGLDQRRGEILTAPAPPSLPCLDPLWSIHGQRGDQRRACFGLLGLGDLFAAFLNAVIEDDLCAIGLGARDFIDGRIGDHDGGGHTCVRRRFGNPLGMVAAGIGDHTLGRLIWLSKKWHSAPHGI